jgi:hypothetical protein
MGYETQMQFVDVQLRPGCLPPFMKAAEAVRNDPEAKHGPMIDDIRLFSNSLGYLDWNLGKTGRRELTKHCCAPPAKVPTAQLAKLADVFVEFWFDGDCCPIGKWYDAESLVKWLFPYCRSGRIIQVSQEGDAAIWGWELNWRKGLRELALVPVTDWCRQTKAARQVRKQLA